MWRLLKLTLRSGTLIFLMTISLKAEVPGISYIYPAGAQRGTKVEVSIGGFYLFDSAPLEFLSSSILASPEVQRLPKTQWFEGPRIAMPASQAKEDYPVDNGASIEVTNEASLGIHYWRVWTSQGIVPAQAFVVGDLPEIIEKEIDGVPVPVDVDLPVTINGRVFPREDVDIWQFQAEQGKSYTLEVMSSRLGYPLDSRIEVVSGNGDLVAQNVDHFDNDSFLRFKAETTGLYQVRIHDSQFGGLQNYVYRLTITDGQVVDSVFPYGGQRGTKMDVYLKGQRVTETPYQIQLTSNTGSQTIALPDGGRFQLQIGEYQEYMESDVSEESTPWIEFPSVMNGQILEPGETDQWSVKGVAGQTIQFDLKAAEFGSSLDSVVELYDKEDKLLASNDDVAKGNTDSSFAFAFKEDGVYRLVVSERFASRGGQGFGYRLTAAEPPSVRNFTLALPAGEITLVREQTAKLKVSAQRFGGLTEEILLEVQGLPEGVTVEGNTIAKGKSDTEITMKCDEKVTISTYDLTVIGTVVVEEEQDNPATAITISATATW